MILTLIKLVLQAGSTCLERDRVLVCIEKIIFNIITVNSCKYIFTENNKAYIEYSVYSLTQKTRVAVCFHTTMSNWTVIDTSFSLPTATIPPEYSTQKPRNSDSLMILSVETFTFGSTLRSFRMTDAVLDQPPTTICSTKNVL